MPRATSVAGAVQHLGQPAGQVEDEEDQPQAAGDELDRLVGAEERGQALEVEGAEDGAGDGAQAPDHDHGDDHERGRRVEGDVGVVELLGGEGEAHARRSPP